MSWLVSWSASLLFRLSFVRPSTLGLSALGLCQRCKQPGHVARECGQTGGQPLLLLLLLIQSLFQLILFLTTLFLFLLLVPGITGTCPLSPRTILLPIQFQFLFRPIRPSLLMISLTDLVPSKANVFRPSQLHLLFLRLKFLLFQDLNLCLFVSKYCLCEEFLYQLLIKCFDWGRGSLPRGVWRA